MLSIPLFILPIWLVNLVQGEESVFNVIEGNSVTLPCNNPGPGELIVWKFTNQDGLSMTIANKGSHGSNIFEPFSVPTSRTTLVGGSLAVNEIQHTEEGQYWCETSSVFFFGTNKGPISSVNVYIKPMEPSLSALGNNPLTESRLATPVARCTSKGGKPAANVTWKNESEPMTKPEIVVVENSTKTYLFDSHRDLVIQSPSQFDHERIFSCIVEHPAYEEPIILNYTVLVYRPPENIKLRADLTTDTVRCEADGYPTPSYYWTRPVDRVGMQINLPGFSALSENTIIVCNAHNSLPPNATTGIAVADLNGFNYSANPKRTVDSIIHAMQGDEVALPCPDPRNVDLRTWIFQARRSIHGKPAARQILDLTPSIYSPFNSPEGRSSVEVENLTIYDINHNEEGEYWCDISVSKGAPAETIRKYSVHVYIPPQEPKVTDFVNGSLTEDEPSTVARCTSHGGKPASNLTWMNGSEPLSGAETIITTNSLRDYLHNSERDLVIESPTRYDHNRTFACVIEHPSYEAPKTLSYTLLVNHHPRTIKIWANFTSEMVYCESDGYPTPTFWWTITRNGTGQKGQSLFIPGLTNLPDDDFFECTADNGFPPNAKLRVYLNDLKPSSGLTHVPPMPSFIVVFLVCILINV